MYALLDRVIGGSLGTTASGYRCGVFQFSDVEMLASKVFGIL